MWLSSSSRKSENAAGTKEALFGELYQEVKTAAPSAQLSYNLRNRLERYERPCRGEICSQVKEGCSPLFIACKKGNVEVSFQNSNGDHSQGC